MGWIRIVVITLIYVHEPKTVTWAKECEIPDYAYTEKRRKNQDGDELICFDQDLERDNALYDSKLLSINTRKKIEGLRDDNYFEDTCRGRRYSDTNNYIPAVLQPPTPNQSTFHQLLHRYQPYGYGPYTMDTPKSVYNIYRTKSQDYDDDPVKEIILPFVKRNREENNQIHHETDNTKLTNSNMDVYTRQADDNVNHNMLSSDQNEGVPISKNYQSTELNKVTELPSFNTPSIINENLYTTDNKLQEFKEKPFKEVQSLQNSFKPIKDSTNASNDLEEDENTNQLFDSMIQKIMNSYNISDKNNLSKQTLVNERKKFNQNNKMNGANMIKQWNSNYLQNQPMTNDPKLPVPAHNKEKMQKYIKQKRVYSRNEGPILSNVARINFAKLNQPKEIRNKINVEANQDNKKLRSENDSINSVNDLGELEDHMIDNDIHPESAYKLFKENHASNVDTVNTNIPTKLTDDIYVPKNIFNPSSNAVNQGQFCAISPGRQKVKNAGWSLFSNNFKGYNSRPKEEELSIDVPLEQALPVENYKDKITPYNSNLFNGESKFINNIEANENWNTTNEETNENWNTTNEDFNNYEQGLGKDIPNQRYFADDTYGISANEHGNDVFNSESMKSENYPENNFDSYSMDEPNEKINQSKMYENDNEQTYKKFLNEEEIMKGVNSEYRLDERNGMYRLPPVMESRKRTKREEGNTVTENNISEKQEETGVNTIGEDSNSPKSDPLNETKEDNDSSIGESDAEIVVNPSSNETMTETMEETIKVNLEEKKPEEVADIKPTSALKKFYNKFNFFRTSDKKAKNRVLTTTELVTEVATNEQPMDSENNENPENIEACSVRKVRDKEFDQQLIKKWMEVQKSFTSHLESQSIPKFPLLKLVTNDNTSLPQFPLEIKMNEDFDKFPFELKDTECDLKNVSLPLENKPLSKMMETKLQTENNADSKVNNLTYPEKIKNTKNLQEIISDQNKKRDIHCCFKLNDGQHSNEQDDHEQLKQIDLKIENKKLKGCPLKETCIEMILTKDRISRGQDKIKSSNHSASYNFNDEMQPFRIGVKNYTQDKSKTNIQGMNEFNKLYSLTKVNKNQDKWDKQIRKLYEIINEEKKGEERNRTTYSSLHKIMDNDQQSIKPPQALQVWNGSITTGEYEKILKQPLLTLPMNKINHILLKNNYEKNLEAEKINKLLKDKKSRKILVNHIIRKLYHPEFYKKEATRPSEKKRYQKGLSKYRNDLRHYSGQNTSIPNQVYYVEGIRVDTPIKDFDPGLNTKTVKGNYLPKNVDKTNLLIPNDEVKTKLMKKCENLKSNISFILNLMSELQNESENKQQMKSYIQYTGFNNLLNNLKKFNRQSSFSSSNGKDMGETLSKLRMGTMNFKDADLKNEVSNSRSFEDEINSTKSDNSSKNLTDTIDIRLTVPTIDTGEEILTSKGLDGHVIRNFYITPEGKLSSDILNSNISEDTQNSVTGAQSGILSSSAELKKNEQEIKTSTEAPMDKSTFEGLKDEAIGKINTSQMPLTTNGNDKSQEALTDKNVDHTVSEKSPELSSDNILYNSIDMLFEATSEKMPETGSEGNQHYSNENILASISGKSIIKLVQKDTPGFDKFNKTCTPSNSENKEDEAEKSSSEPEPYIIKIASVPTNFKDPNVEKYSIKKLGSIKSLSRNNSAGIFDAKKITKIANNMQAIPHQLTMPIILDILNSLLCNEQDSQFLQNKEDADEKRLKRENYKPYNLSLYPSNDNLEINMKVKKGKRKKGRKNKYSYNKSAISHLKAATPSTFIKSSKKNKSDPSKRKMIKPIYMPNFQGHSGLHIVPPFFFGDNIITISVTPCDEYHRKGKFKINGDDFKGNDTVVNETKYFVMSNIRGDGGDKEKSRFETQLRLPLKFFRSRERTTTVSNRRKMGTTSRQPTTKSARLENFLLNIPLDEKKVTTTQKKIPTTTRSEIVKVNENTESKLKIDNPKELKLFKENNNTKEMPEDWTYLHHKMTTHEAPEGEFTITITLKPPKEQNEKDSNENTLYAYTVQPFTIKHTVTEDIKKNKTESTDMDYDMDYYNDIQKTNWQLKPDTSTNRAFHYSSLAPVTEVEARQYLVSPPILHMKSNNNLFNLKGVDFPPKNNSFKFDMKTTPKFFMQTPSAEEFKDIDNEIFYEDFKELKNDAISEALKVNVTKDEMKEILKQTLVTPMVTEAVDDYIFNLDQMPEDRIENAKELNTTNQQEAKQNAIVNESLQQSTENVMVTETESSSESEDKTEVQYDDELESVMETYGERPRVATLFQPLFSTIPLTEAPVQTEAEEALNFQYGMTFPDPYQEITQSPDMIRYSTEMIPDQTQAESKYPYQEEKNVEETPKVDMNWPIKGEEKFPNPVGDEQMHYLATPIIPSTTTGRDFEEAYKEGENNKEEDEDEDEEDEDKYESLKETHVNATTVQIFNSQPTTPAYQSTTEEEQEEDDEDDEETTDFQELLFWQNVTKKPKFEFQQPFMVPAEMKAFEADFKNNTGNATMDEDVKTMKQELEQLKELLHNSPLLDNADSMQSATSTQSYSNFTQEVTSEKVMETNTYTENQEEADTNDDSEDESIPNLIIENTPNYDNKTYQRNDQMVITNDKEDVNYATPPVNKTNTDENRSYPQDNQTNSPTEQDDSESDDESDELTLDEDEDDIDSSNYPEVMQLDNSPETIDDASIDTYNIDPYLEKSNTSINEFKMPGLENPIIDLNNQVELPPNSFLNGSGIETPNAEPMKNNTYQIHSAKKHKKHYWSKKSSKNNHFKNTKGNTSGNLGNGYKSEVIILDNVSNDPAEWVLHDDSMGIIHKEPWESLKQAGYKKVEMPSKMIHHKDKFVRDFIMSKAALNEPTIFRGRDSSTLNLPMPLHSSNNFLNNPKLFVRLNNEQLQSKTRNLLEQINRKCVKAPHYRNKYNGILNDGTLVLLRPHYSSLKGNRYNFDNEKNLESFQPMYIKNSAGLKESKLNVKEGIENNVNLQKFYSPHKEADKIHSSKKSKIQNKPSKKHRNRNDYRKRLKNKQKINKTSAQPQKPTARVSPSTPSLESTESSPLKGEPEGSSGDTHLSTIAPNKPTHDEHAEINQLTTPGTSSTSKMSSNQTNIPGNITKSKVSSKTMGNLENLLWNRYDRWDRLNDNLNRVEKLYDKNMMKKINQNFRKNMYRLDAGIQDKRKNVINCSRKSNQKNINFYKQRLNRKMTLLKSLQNKNNEAKITPEEEIKIKKILDGIVSRYKGRTNDTDEEDYFRFKANKFSAPTRRNMTRLKTHRRLPKPMRFDRNRFKCRSKERFGLHNYTDSQPPTRFLSIGRNKKFPLPPAYARFYKKYKNAKDGIKKPDQKDITKINDKRLWTAYCVPLSKTANDQQLHRDKKDYVLGIPYIRTLPTNNSAGYVSIINSQIKKVTNSSVSNLNRGNNGIKETVSEGSPNLNLYGQKRGKLQTGVPIQGILSLFYSDNPSNASEPVNLNDKVPVSGCPLGSNMAGYSGAPAPSNNNQYNFNQFEDLIKCLENENINVTENNEHKYKELATIFKENQKEIGRNKSRDTIDEIKVKLKALDWLLNFRNSPKFNRLQFKDILQSTATSKQEGSPFDQSHIKDREEDVENMKKFITKYKTLLKMFEEQYGKMDVRENINQKLVKNYKDDAANGIVIVQKPMAYSKKVKSREKNIIRTEEGNNKKKIHKMYISGQSKPRKDIENPGEELQENEDQEIIRHLLDDDDDNLETCNDIEIESYDEHQLDKIKENDLAMGNMTLLLGNGTNPILRDGPRPLFGKYKSPDKFKGFHNNQITRLKTNGSLNKLFRNHLTPLSCMGEPSSDRCKTNWENWTMDKPCSNSKLQPMVDENHSNFTYEEKDIALSGNDNVLMLPIKFNTSDFIKLLNFKEGNETDSYNQDEEEQNPINRRTKQWDFNNRNSYIFDVDRGGPNGIKNRYYITFDSLSPNTVKVKNVSTIPMSNFSEFVSMANAGLNVMSIHKFMSPWDKNSTQICINNKNVKGNLKPEIRSIEKVCLWLRKPLSYNLTHQVPKVAISLGEVWPPMNEGQTPRNMKHYLVQVDPLVTPSKYPNQHIDYPSQISKVVWKAILHGFKTPKKTWQLSNQLG